MTTRRAAGTAAIIALVMLLGACIPDGTYLVGPGCRYCQPQFLGRYWSPGGDGCYLARLRNSSGAPSSVIASEFRRRQGVVIVDVHPTDALFLTHGCTDWKPAVSPTTDSPTSPKLSDWDYRVNVDIAPGTWEADPDPTVPDYHGCYWARLSGFGKTPAEVVAEGFDSRQPSVGHQVVHISSADAGFTSSGCTAWVRTGD